MEANGNILDMLQKGCDYLYTHHNMPKGYEYFVEARKTIEKTYGKNSRLCCFVNAFDYIWEDYHGDYRQAALKLADVAELIETFHEQDVEDEFTGYLYENRESLLDGLASETLQILMKEDSGLSPGDMMWQAVLAGNDREELINRTLIDPLGLPRKFNYLIPHICNMTINPSPEMISEGLEMIKFIEEAKRKDWDASSENEKFEAAKKVFSFIETEFPKWGEKLGGGMSILIDEKYKSLTTLMTRGALKFDKTEFAERWLGYSKLQNFQDVSSQLEMMRLESYLEYKKGNREESSKILGKIVEEIGGILSQVFATANEQKKIEFLNGMEAILRKTIYLCKEVSGANAAYALVLRTRTLSFDRKGVVSGSILYTKSIQEYMKLEEREKNGEDVTLEKAKFEEYFERESDGIFSLESEHVCGKLTDRQAVLEFVLLEDISGYNYYCVFVVTAQGVSVVELGGSAEIDAMIGGIKSYISEYEVSKYNTHPIRMLRDYYDIYEKVIQPIGSILSHNIQRLFIVGVGRFLEIPFGMLPCFQMYDEFMDDRYQICYLNSGKELLRNADTVKGLDAVVVGNPNFSGKFPALPSSLRETEAVAKILNVKPFTGNEAVPDCLEKRAGIFHISTHSFEEEREDKNIDRMVQTGLVFAGGQKLTAKEIARLDMTRTKLVVLSVCGVKEGREIYSDVGPGIRRAFISAGVRCLILNLWKTDDNAAELMMKCFYHYYVGKKLEIEEAIRKAKHYLRTSTIEEIRKGEYYDKGMEKIFEVMSEKEIPYKHPYYWAGFIVMGA